MRRSCVTYARRRGGMCLSEQDHNSVSRHLSLFYLGCAYEQDDGGKGEERTLPPDAGPTSRFGRMRRATVVPSSARETFSRGCLRSLHTSLSAMSPRVR